MELKVEFDGGWLDLCEPPIENGIYHVASRGGERRVIVRHDADCQHWLDLLDRVAAQWVWRAFVDNPG